MKVEEQLAKARTDAAEALNQAKEIRGKYADDQSMGAEDKEVFDKAMKGFKEHHSLALSLGEDVQNLRDLATHEETYLKPVEQHQKPRGAPDTKKQKENHARAMYRYIRGGIGVLTPEEVNAYVMRDPEIEQISEEHALLGTVDNLGGFAVTDDFMDGIIRDTAGFSVMRAQARVKSTKSSAASFLTIASGTDPYPSGVSGSWRSEGWVSGGTAPATQNQPTFGRERIPVHIWTPDVIELTQELLEDSQEDLEAEIRNILAETKALDEDSGFINGSGVGQPEGILNAGLTTVTSGAAGAQTYGGLVNLYVAVPAQYRQSGKWIMNSLTYGLLLVLEDTEGHNLFPVNQDLPKLFGKDILFSEFMPDGDTATNNAIVFGDLRNYGIADRKDLRIIRLVERYAPNVGIMAIARTGGQVLRTSGLRMQVVGS